MIRVTLLSLRVFVSRHAWLDRYLGKKGRSGCIAWIRWEGFKNCMRRSFVSLSAWEATLYCCTRIADLFDAFEFPSE